MDLFDGCGQLLRELRESKGPEPGGWSREKLAERSGLSKETIQNIEGKRGNPTVRSLGKLLRAGSHTPHHPRSRPPLRDVFRSRTTTLGGAGDRTQGANEGARSQPRTGARDPLETRARDGFRRGGLVGSFTHEPHVDHAVNVAGLPLTTVMLGE